MLVYVMLHIGATWTQWREEHGPPLLLEGTLAVRNDGPATLDVGDVPADQSEGRGT